MAARGTPGGCCCPAAGRGDGLSADTVSACRLKAPSWLTSRLLAFSSAGEAAGRGGARRGAGLGGEGVDAALLLLA